MELEISAAATDAYASHASALLDAVNRTMAQAPDCVELIGGNPLEVMYANHRHHHGTVLTVLRLGAWPLLERTVPWVYASYLAHGFSPDYFPRLFAAWQGALREQLPSPQAGEMSALYDWFTEHHAQHLEAARSRVQLTVPVAPEWAQEFDELLRALLAGNSQAVIAIGQGRIDGPESVVSFYVGALAPALHEVGRRWEAGKVSVAHEHLASGVANRVMSYWYHHILDARPSLGKAVVTSGPNEFHSLGGAMLADALAVDGWEVIALGANTPEEDLVALANEYRPDLVALSITMPFNILPATRSIERLRELPACTGTQILVGGQAFWTMPDLWKRTGADGFARTIPEALEVARTAWSGQRA